MVVSTSIRSVRGISEDGGRKPDKTEVEVQEDKKRKDEERNSNGKKTSSSEQVVYLCLSVGEWLLLFWQECLPVWDH
jgi:hypothetical protein